MTYVSTWFVSKLSVLVLVAVVYIACCQVVGSFREVNLEKQLCCRVLLCSLSTGVCALNVHGSED